SRHFLFHPIAGSVAQLTSRLHSDLLLPHVSPAHESGFQNDCWQLATRPPVPPPGDGKDLRRNTAHRQILLQSVAGFRLQFLHATLLSLPPVFPAPVSAPASQSRLRLHASAASLHDSLLAVRRERHQERSTRGMNRWMPPCRRAHES